ncbi:HNH endonuclease [Sphingobium sp. TCM1]|uniref:HNH endonuclease n=1 Tax=Sphingobium sp. TCM1 TaxID=453246 RepID=UPI001E4F6DB0|nr:HNH endonuclease [Sphingobium sp. TCM1]
MKVRGSRGYFAVAKVEQVIPDPQAPGMYIAMIQLGSYLEFANAVPFSGVDGLAERGLLNDAGKISGRAQSAVRPISPADFNRILDLGLEDRTPLLPRVGDLTVRSEEAIMPFLIEQERARTERLVSRVDRDRIFRRVVLQAYDERCAITGLKLINGGGRAEAEAAHIRPVEADGPDAVQNGIALSGTVHWMFDRGLISLSDDLDIMISRQANDTDSVTALINRSGRANLPLRLIDRPHPHFLAWHRDNVFKQ